MKRANELLELVKEINEYLNKPNLSLVNLYSKYRVYIYYLAI